MEHIEDGLADLAAQWASARRAGARWAASAPMAPIRAYENGVNNDVGRHSSDLYVLFINSIRDEATICQTRGNP